MAQVILDLDDAAGLYYATWNNTGVDEFGGGAVVFNRHRAEWKEMGAVIQELEALIEAERTPLLLLLENEGGDVQEPDTTLVTLWDDRDKEPDTTKPHLPGCPRLLSQSAECLCNSGGTRLPRK